MAAPNTPTGSTTIQKIPFDPHFSKWYAFKRKWQSLCSSRGADHALDLEQLADDYEFTIDNASEIIAEQAAQFGEQLTQDQIRQRATALMRKRIQDQKDLTAILNFAIADKLPAPLDQAPLDHPYRATKIWANLIHIYETKMQATVTNLHSNLGNKCRQFDGRDWFTHIHEIDVLVNQLNDAGSPVSEGELHSNLLQGLRHAGGAWQDLAGTLTNTDQTIEDLKKRCLALHELRTGSPGPVSRSAKSGNRDDNHDRRQNTHGRAKGYSAGAAESSNPPCSYCQKPHAGGRDNCHARMADIKLLKTLEAKGGKPRGAPAKGNAASAPKKGKKGKKGKKPGPQDEACWECGGKHQRHTCPQYKARMQKERSAKGAMAWAARASPLLPDDWFLDIELAPPPPTVNPDPIVPAAPPAEHVPELDSDDDSDPEPPPLIDWDSDDEPVIIPPRGVRASNLREVDTPAWNQFFQACVDEMASLMDKQTVILPYEPRPLASVPFSIVTSRTTDHRPVSQRYKSKLVSHGLKHAEQMPKTTSSNPPTRPLTQSEIDCVAYTRAFTQTKMPQQRPLTLEELLVLEMATGEVYRATDLLPPLVPENAPPPHPLPDSDDDSSDDGGPPPLCPDSDTDTAEETDDDGDVMLAFTIKTTKKDDGDDDDTSAGAPASASSKPKKPTTYFGTHTQAKETSTANYTNKSGGGKTYKFIIDSGATEHLVKDRELMTNLQTTTRTVQVAQKDTVIHPEGTGVARFLVTKTNLKKLPVRAPNVLYSPEFSENLLSMGRLLDAGLILDVTPDQSGISLNDGRDYVPFQRNGALWELPVEPVFSTPSAQAMAGTTPPSFTTTYADFHLVMGHASNKALKKLQQQHPFFTLQGEPPSSCTICEESKAHNLPAPRSNSRAKKPFELVHLDAFGPMKKKSISGARFGELFLDDHTRFLFLYCVTQKSHYPSVLQDLIALAQSLGYEIGTLRSDNAAEYTQPSVKALERKHTINRQFSNTYEAWQNGRAERAIKSVVEKARCLMLQAGTPKRFWGTACQYAVFLINCLPHSSNPAQETPWTLMYGVSPPLDSLKTYGCLCWVRRPQKLIKDAKLDPRAVACIFVGIATTGQKGYLCYSPQLQRIICSTQVKFDQKRFPLKTGLPSNTPDLSEWESAPGSSGEKSAEAEDEPEPDTVEKKHNSDSDEDDDGEDLFDLSGQTTGGKDDDSENESPAAGAKTRGQARAQKLVGVSVKKDFPPHGTFKGKVTKFESPYFRVQYEDGDEEDMTEAEVLGHQIPIVPESEKASLTSAYENVFSLATAAKGTDPVTFEEAMSRPDADKWKEALEKEMQSLKDLNSFEWVDPPEGVKPIPSKVIYKIKYDQDGKISKHKCRIVVKGFRQKKYIDYNETFAPVAYYTLVRFLIALANELDWDLDQLDVATAFLNTRLKELVYMTPPPEFVRVDGKIMKLLSCVYGLKQAPREWHETLVTSIKDYGFEQVGAETCFYKLTRNEGVLLVLIYVDDILVTGSNRKMIKEFKQMLGKLFKITDEGPVKHYLGVHIQRDRIRKTTTLDQKQYVEDVLERFGMQECKPVTTPAEPNTRLSKKDSPEKPDPKKTTEYREVVGSLQYLSVWTRPDITFSVSELSRFMHSPGDTHMTAAKRVLRYLRGTKALGLKYKANTKGQKLLPPSTGPVWCDADWAGDPDTRRSTTGFVAKMGHNTIEWKTRRQPTVALSSSEAEYMALTSAVSHILWHRQLMANLGFGDESPTIIYEDNTGCLAMAENQVSRDRTKHIDIKLHFCREAVQNKQVMIIQCPTERMTADILTKALQRGKFETFRAAAMNAESDFDHE